MTHYKEQYFFNSYNYSYKRGRLDNVNCHDGISIKYFYDPKGNVKSDIMTNGLDTLRVITYSYRNNELYEIFRYTNEIDNKRIVFSKSNDTIIETSIYHDSVYMNEPRVDIIKKKYNKHGLAYSLAFNKEEESTVESFITYDSIGSISKIEYVYVEEKIESKEKYEINYRNGFVNRIEKFELINNIWQQEDLIIYKLEMTNKRANKKIKSKINFYFIKKEMEIL